MSPVKICAVLLLVSITLGAGLQINREHFIAVLKDYGLLARALVANVVLVPIFGVVLVGLFHLPEYIAVGLLLMAVAPGVPFALQAAGRKKGGSVGFAVALVVILQLVSVVTVPITLGLVLPAGDEAHLPIGPFLVKLVLLQFLPLLVGFLIADRAPAAAAKLERPAMIVFVLAVLGIVVLLGSTIVKSVADVFGSGGMLAMLAVVILSILSGWFLGGPDPAQRRTLSIATALRNIGLASLVATTSFAGTEVAGTVLTYMIIQFVTCTIVGTYFGRTARAAASAAA